MNVVTLFESETGQSSDGRSTAGHKFVKFLQEHLLAFGSVGADASGIERHRRPAESVLQRRVFTGLCAGVAMNETSKFMSK